MMKELEKVSVSAVAGPLKEKVLSAFQRRITEWGLVMPDVEPLVLDFGLGDFEHVGLIEYWIANETEAGYCGKYLFLFDGQRCPAHKHALKHETFYVVKGAVKMTVDGKDRTLGIGNVLAMPQGCVHTFEAEGDSLILEISMPCLIADNYFEDRTIQNWLQRNHTTAN